MGSVGGPGFIEPVGPRAGSRRVRREVHDRIVSSLRRWEPRIEVEGVDVDEVERQPTQVRVRIRYRLRRTGVPASLGLTLETGS